MGWLDKLFRRRPTGAAFAPNLGGWSPTFSQFGNSIYASDVVQQALKCIVDEIKKLNPQHVRLTGSDPVPVNDSTVQKVLNDPNPIMTTTEFLEKVTWLLLLNYNAFIVPTYRVWRGPDGVERRYYDGLYPIQPSTVNFLEDTGGRLFVNFIFPNGTETTLPYSDVIHVKYNFSINQYMGGNEYGQPDNGPVLETLRLNDAMLKGLAKSLNASTVVNGVVKYKTLMDDGKMKKAIEEFSNRLRANEDGLLGIDIATEYTPIERKVASVDASTLKFLDEKILRNWGIPLAILTGDFTKEQYEAFYQKTLEGIIISMSQAFTKKLFTEREKAYGNKVTMYPKDLIFMTVSQTLEMINILSPTGALFENEKRAALGLRPLPELEGKRYMSLNWVDAEIAATYQVGPDQEQTQTQEQGTEE